MKFNTSSTSKKNQLGQFRRCPWESPQYRPWSIAKILAISTLDDSYSLGDHINQEAQPDHGCP
jgi:hypothetical protein